MASLQDILERMASDAREQLVSQAEEITALGSIYATPEQPKALEIYSTPSNSSSRVESPGWSPEDGKPFRFTLLTTTLSEPFHELNVLISLPFEYPNFHPPQLQIQNKYIGPFQITEKLFTDVLRTFMHDHSTGEGVHWSPGDICVFEGVEFVRQLCSEWADTMHANIKEKEQQREEHFAPYQISSVVETPSIHVPKIILRAETKCPAIYSTEPIVDRKSQK